MKATYLLVIPIILKFDSNIGFFLRLLRNSATNTFFSWLWHFLSSLYSSFAVENKTLTIIQRNHLCSEVLHNSFATIADTNLLVQIWSGCVLYIRLLWNVQSVADGIHIHQDFMYVYHLVDCLAWTSISTDAYGKAEKKLYKIYKRNP